MFGPQSRTYTNGGHIVTKIGDYYYDVQGVLFNYINNLENLEPYEYEDGTKKPLICNNFYKEDLLGNYVPEEDNKIIEIGVQAGLKYLATIMETYQRETKIGQSTQKKTLQS